MSILGFLSNIGGSAGVVDNAKNLIEYNTLTSMGVPSFLATWLQQQRMALGFAPIINPPILYLIGIIVILIFTGLIAFGFGIFTKFLGIFAEVFQGKPVSKFKIIIFCLTIGFLISLTLYFFFIKPILKATKVNVQDNLSKIFGTESFINQPTDTSLINLQSLAVKQTAYIGPSEKGGTFDPVTGIQSVLKTGTRFFVLQISYLEVKKDPTNFDAPYIPTLVYRDDSGKLISANGASIKDVATNLANYAFAPSVQSSNQPLIIYLHFERTPNQLRTPEKYVKYLSSVAQMLEPLQPYLIGNMPEGNFKRQNGESILLSLPVSKFEQKAIILCNVDTSIFRNLATLGMTQIDAKYDLDVLVNVRVYLDVYSDKIGATSPPMNGQVPSAVIVPFSRIDSFDSDSQDLFALKGKSRYVIAMPSQMSNPSVDSITTAISKCGVNCIPLNLFGEDISILTQKVKVWGGEPFYTIKPANYRTLDIGI